MSDPSILFDDAPSPPASSASIPNISRAHWRDSGDGSAQAGHRSTPLTETELMVPTPRAAVAGIAGGVFAGDGELGSRVRGRESDPLRRSDPLCSQARPLTLNPTRLTFF